jgi:kynureninase
MTALENAIDVREDEALALDRDDPSSRSAFAIPPWPGEPGAECAYFAGNSLGLQPLAVREALAQELDEWARLGVEGFFVGGRPWLRYHELLRDPLARLVGASPSEVVAMNTLTMNLHLMLASFYRPAGQRHRILIEDAAFPSDSYAVASQAVLHGLDPETAIVRLRPRQGEAVLRTEDVIETLERDGDSIALVLLGGVNYVTGQLMDMSALAAAGHRVGAVVGWDLAHAIGNVPLSLHDWDADFAVWCSYKYLNGGPGAIGGCFVHDRHGGDARPPRLSGWWGNDPATRFQMEPTFVPHAGADGWQVSTTPILSLAPVLVSLQMFDRIGIDHLRARSVRLTGYLESLLDQLVATHELSVITPRDPVWRGCQLSLVVADAGALARRLADEYGVICDVRNPNVVRLAPVPLYSTYHDCWRAAAALARLL